MKLIKELNETVNELSHLLEEIEDELEGFTFICEDDGTIEWVPPSAEEN